MTRPHCCSTMWRSAARVAQNVEFRIQSIASDHASSVISWTRAKPPDPPALLTRMSTAP